VINDLQLGGFNDVVSLRLGSDEVRIAESYEVKCAVVQQPSAFTLRLGWNKTAAELLAKYPPRTQFELYIGPNQIMSGLTYSRGQPSANYTTIEFRGRDYLAPLMDDEVQREYAFTDKTYFELTRRILNVVGLKEDLGDGQGGPTRFVLYDSNDSNRELISRVTKAKPKQRGEIVQLVETGTNAGQGKVFYKNIRAKTGTRWLDFLQDQYKLAGLFLWSTGSGNFVLARPRADMDPACRIQRTRNATRKQGDVVACSFEDNITMRHAACVVYGKGGIGKDGRANIQGYFVDDEMTAMGAQNVRTIHDNDIKTTKEADYVARRTIAEERRSGWRLSYTVSGHIFPSLVAKGGYGVWTIDTVCRVDDDELDIHGNFYVEAVTYRRGPETTTEIELMRPQDLVFAEGLFGEETNGKTFTGTPKKLKPGFDMKKARAEAAEKFAREFIAEKQGPKDLLEGLRR
jgi:prophage tail gpP-like protein